MISVLTLKYTKDLGLSSGYLLLSYSRQNTRFYLVSIQKGVFINENIYHSLFIGFSVGIRTLAIFIITKIFPLLQDSLGQHGSYWLLGSIALSSNMFFYFCVPETKGKSFVEIQQKFRKSLET